MEHIGHSMDGRGPAAVRRSRCDVCSPRHLALERPPSMSVAIRRAVVVAALLASASVSAAQGPPAATPAQGPGRGGFVPAPVVIGPSAPVPPEVTIPRPTPTDLTQVNEALQKFIDSDKSAVKPLLKKYESLML